MNELIELERRFFSVFRAWFDADIVNLNDAADLDSAIQGCVMSLGQEFKELRPLYRWLIGIRHQLRQPNVVADFERAGHVDWSADHHMQERLEQIIDQIIKDLPGIGSELGEQ